MAKRDWWTRGKPYNCIQCWINRYQIVTVSTEPSHDRHIHEVG